MTQPSKERGAKEEEGTIKTFPVSLKLTSCLPEFIPMATPSCKGDRKVTLATCACAQLKLGPLLTKEGENGYC